MPFEKTDCIDEIFADPDWLSKLTMAGTDYDCIRTTIEHVEEVLPAGMSEQYKFSLLCKTKDFPLMPDVGVVIEFEGREYRILKSEMGTTGQSFKLHLAEKFGSL